MHICRRVRENLHDYVMGQLNTDAVRELEEHIAECEECRRLLDIQKLYCENIPHIAAALGALPEGKNLADSVTSQIEQEKDSPPVYIARRRFPFATAAVLAVIMLALLFAHRAGMTENYMEKTEDFADLSTASSENNTADYEYTNTDMLYSAVTQEAPATETSDEVILKQARGESLSDKLLADTAECDCAPEDTAQTEPPMAVIMSTSTAATGSAVNSAVTESACTDQPTCAPEENDPALAAHKNIAQYNDFIASNAIIPLYPQVILHGGDKEFYYNNFVMHNTGGTLIEGKNFFCLHMSADSLIDALSLCGISDYTVIQPESPLSDDMVYLWYE